MYLCNNNFFRYIRPVTIKKLHWAKWHRHSTSNFNIIIILSCPSDRNSEKNPILSEFPEIIFGTGFRSETNRGLSVWHSFSELWQNFDNVDLVLNQILYVTRTMPTVQPACRTSVTGANPQTAILHQFRSLIIASTKSHTCVKNEILFFYISFDLMAK